MQPFESMFSGGMEATPDMARQQQSYERQANYLRMRFLDIFHSVMDDFDPTQTNWAVYKEPDSQHNVPDQVFVSRYLALIAYRPIDAADDVTTLALRVISNDYYVSADGKKQMMLEDFMLDTDNDAHYCIWSANADLRNLSNRPVPQFILDDDDNLMFVGLPSFPETSGVDPKTDGLPTIYPYGNFGDIDDKTSMLYMGHDLLTEVAGRSPMVSGHN